MRGVLALAFLAYAAASVVDEAQAEAAAAASNSNPIRKVVTLLQAMQKKVEEEGKKEKELYDNFMCYCKTNGQDLTARISSANTKVPQVQSEIEQAEAQKAQLEQDLQGHQSDREAAKTAMKDATAVREKEAAAFAATKSESDVNIAALTKATAAVEKGSAGAFLQTRAASALRKLMDVDSNLEEEDKETLTAFLSAGQNAEYAPQSGQILGILKMMGDEMAKSLADATAAEEASIKNYQALMSAKTEEVSTLSAGIEAKLDKIAELGVAIAQMKNDLGDTEEALIADKAFLAELETSCKTKTAEWEEIKKTRSEELVALSETIKILNDDDALELFKKTIPSASSSLLQLSSGASTAKARALAVIRKAQKGHKSPALDFIALALNGKKIGFAKVIKMVDEMVVNLKKEQQDDDAKKEYCEKMMDEAEDKVKALELTVSDSESAIEEMKGMIETLGAEIKALTAGIKDLDASVGEATENRKEENADYKDLVQSDSAAKEILLFAKNRLNKFYNPKLYVAPPKTTEEASFVQIRAHTQKGFAAPPPPPETFGAYTKKSEDSNGVISMIDLLVKDLDKELQESEIMEKEAQKDYETMMEESSAKRAADSKSLTQKEGSKASTEGELEAEQDKKKATVMDLMATEKYIGTLHGECDWILSNYDARKAARTSESEALVQAKAVLNGADFSLLQTSKRLRGA